MLTTSAGEFAEWLAAEQLDPTSEWWTALRMAFVCCALGNFGRDQKAGRALTIDDFMANSERHSRKPKSPEQLAAIIDTWAKTHNAILAAKEKRRSPSREP